MNTRIALLVLALTGCASPDPETFAREIVERCAQPVSDCTREEYRMAMALSFAGTQDDK